MSVDKHDSSVVTIRGSQLTSRHLSLDSSLWDKRKLFTLETIKSEQSLSSCDEEDITDQQNSTPTEVTEIPDDIDDRIDRSGMTDGDDLEDEFPIRGTIVASEELPPEPQPNVRYLIAFLISHSLKILRLLVLTTFSQCLFTSWYVCHVIPFSNILIGSS